MSDLPPSTIPPEDEDKSDEVDQRAAADEEPEDGEKQEKKDDDMEVSENEQVKDKGEDTAEEDEEERDRRRIGGKKGKHFMPAGTLTSVLVTRDEDERNRQKQKSKSEKQKLKKLAREKTDFIKYGKKGEHIGKGHRGHRKGRDGKGFDGGQWIDDDLGSSDEEANARGGRTAPFMEQYKTKKHIEHVLEEQHYWSDPEKDKENFSMLDTISAQFDSDSSGSEEDIIGPDGQILRVKKKKRRRHDHSDDTSGSEEEIIGPDGQPVRVKKKFRHDEKARRRGRRNRSDDGDDISNADSEYLRQKSKKRAGSLDSMMSVDDRKKLNEHTKRSDSDDNAMSFESDDDVFINGEDDQKTKGKSGELGDESYYDKDGNLIKRKGKTKTIHVKEKSKQKGDYVQVKRLKKDGKHRGDLDNDKFSDNELDKSSDRDSGMDDDDEGDVDVILTPEQQALIVNMLFDEEMNVRPQFYRDENGRIVRRLDNTVIFDPHTGRFTFKKRLGQIFKQRRLKRNDKGRPIGGYIDDEFGPKSDQDKASRRTSSARGSRASRRDSDIRSASADTKRSRADLRNVGFDVPENDIDALNEEESGYNKRGNRSKSAMQRLRRRLFGKKQRAGKGPGTLPDVKVKNAWGGDENVYGGQGIYGSGYGQPGLGPVNIRYGQRSPWGHRSGGPSAGDPNKMQMYREGLESDRKFLENLQGRLNSQDQLTRSSESFGRAENGQTGDLSRLPAHHGHGHRQTPHFHGEYSFFDDDGKLIIREKGCPELKNPTSPLFTIVRRPGEMDSDERLDGHPTQDRTVKSAPMAVQDYEQEQQNSDLSNADPNYVSENSVARSDGQYSRYSYIDNNRLRRLLEELYQDKKYLDRYIETTEPKSEAVIHSKGLAEHGRGYLLERADYWEKRGPLPPRPPMTEVGWKMQRQAYFASSRQTSELGLSTNTTCTPEPELSARHLPGVVESPSEDNIEFTDQNHDHQRIANESQA